MTHCVGLSFDFRFVAPGTLHVSRCTCEKSYQYYPDDLVSKIPKRLNLQTDGIIYSSQTFVHKRVQKLERIVPRLTRQFQCSFGRNKNSSRCKYLSLYVRLHFLRARFEMPTRACWMADIFRRPSVNVTDTRVRAVWFFFKEKISVTFNRWILNHRAARHAETRREV